MRDFYAKVWYDYSNMTSVAYETAQVAVNAVVFTVKKDRLSVYSTPREKSPFKSLPELPGGLLIKNETAEETLRRKLKGIFGIENIYFRQFMTFTSPKRDPRTRTISIGYIALVPENKVLNITGFTDLKKLSKLAFDHKQIVDNAHKYLADNLSSRFISEFMPENFPLNDLQKVYETITGEAQDNRNFRKKMIEGGFVKKVNKIQKNVAHRPATLYKFSKSLD